MLTSSFSMSTKFFNFFLSFSAFPHQRRLLIYHIITTNVNTFNKSSFSYVTNTVLCISDSSKQNKNDFISFFHRLLQRHEYVHLQNQIKVLLTLSSICIPFLFSLLFVNINQANHHLNHFLQSNKHYADFHLTKSYHPLYPLLTILIPCSLFYIYSIYVTEKDWTKGRNIMFFFLLRVKETLNTLA